MPRKFTSKGLARKCIAPTFSTNAARSQTRMGCIPAKNHLRAGIEIHAAIIRDVRIFIMGKPPMRKEQAIKISASHWVGIQFDPDWENGSKSRIWRWSSIHSPVRICQNVPGSFRNQKGIRSARLENVTRKMPGHEPAQH